MALPIVTLPNTTTQDDDEYTPYDMRVKVREDITPGAPNMADPANSEAKPFTVKGQVYTKRPVYRDAINDLSDKAKGEYTRIQSEFREKNGREMDREVANIRAQLAAGDLTKDQAKKLAWGLRKNRDLALAKDVAKESGEPDKWRDYYAPTTRFDIVRPEQARKVRLDYVNFARDFAVKDNDARDINYPGRARMAKYLSRRFGYVQDRKTGVWGEPPSPQERFVQTVKEGPAVPPPTDANRTVSVTRIEPRPVSRNNGQRMVQDYRRAVLSDAVDNYLAEVEMANEVQNLYRPYSVVRTGPTGGFPDRVRVREELTPRVNMNRAPSRMETVRVITPINKGRYEEIRATRDRILSQTTGPLGPAIKRRPYEGPQWKRRYEKFRDLELPPTRYPHDWPRR